MDASGLDASASVASVVAPPRLVRRVLLATTVVATLAFTLRIVVDTLGYLSFDPHYAFLVERPLLTANHVWLACFYVHVAGGAVCLLTAPLLLWNGLANGPLRVHRAVGRVHLVAALGWTGPTGLYMAWFAKGGLAGQVGFGLMGALFVFSTAWSVRAIRRGDLLRHVAWMNRSYALLLSALTFRLIHPALYACGIAEGTSYVLSTWSSLLLAIACGELMNVWFRPATSAAFSPRG